MALSETRLSNKFLEILETEALEELNDGQSRQRFSQLFAKAIIEEIMEAKIGYNNGLTAGANTVVGTFNHTIS